MAIVMLAILMVHLQTFSRLALVFCDCAARADRRDRGPPHGLLNGWDNIALTESYMDKIAAFKMGDRAGGARLRRSGP